MKIIVIGSGLAGIASAYYLSRSDCRVTVVDRATGPAKETSFANGSLITPSLADPWNEPGVFKALVSSIGREDSPMLLRPGAVAGMVGWGISFLRNSSRHRFEQAYLRNVRFSQYSLRVMHQLLREVDLKFDHARDGTIKVFRDAAALEEGMKTARFLEQADVEHRALTVDELLEMQPALTPVAERLAGAIAYPDDEVGDAHLFCEELHRASEDRGVSFRYGQEVSRLLLRGNEVQGVVTREATLTADAYVLAAGSFSVALARPLGLRLPIRPAKGYSITMPMGDWPQRPRYPIIDRQLRAAVVPVGDRLRVAGTAEFAGYDTTIAEPRVRNLRAVLRQTYPQFEEQLGAMTDLNAWAGLRPMTADGSPILGRSPITNLYLNTGHGALGWTMACGSGKAVADVICGRDADVDLAGFEHRG